MVALGYKQRYALQILFASAKQQLFKFARLLNTMALKENKHLKLIKAVYTQFLGLKLISPLSM